MSQDLNRRTFIKATAASAAIGLSFEEQALRAAENTPALSPTVKTGKKMSTGKIGNVEISRLICGGNLISGYAHSRDLIYVSPLLKNYFTDDKIMDTWQICEESGITTMNINPSDLRAVKLFNRYWKERGGKMQWLAQIDAKPNDLETPVKLSIDHGAVGVYLVGNLGDRWVFDNRVDLIDKLVRIIKNNGVIAGVAGHSLEMLVAVESANLPIDFYMKTFHHTDYWSARREDQTKQVIDNYAVDNYYDMTPRETMNFMKEVKKPWIAYKVLAAGAIKPQSGFDYAFGNGADFVCVGMFDWQVAEDVALAEEAIAKNKNRVRPWMG
ncbi:MAG: hypothetical protein GX455_06935 [Phycisphaerae bacterium]|nr:hypothetical protein [Phycisphaerae bacterium]